ncbi:MAG: hypothetical protein HC902_02185 [Calothrix sp. SM1_5_4]|nr:hypothetical protein [Calothrix sp. SM1_5_4]
MRLWNWSRAVGVAALVSTIFSIACTRKAADSSVTVKVPFSSSLASLSSVYSLDMAIVNVYVPGRPLPIEAKLETKRSSSTSAQVPIGQAIEIRIPDVPKGSGYLVQFLGVYRGSTSGDMKFYYGDAQANVTGDTVVNIEAKSAGTSSGKEARIAGRYLKGTSPDQTSMAAFLAPGAQVTLLR